ncbi:cupin domain-containing protein [Paracoccus saliphilus]|uniref:Cupin domain-containing protein n=1 Tax=Paracoccus saliphilus TaxID=405559 RepID=A0AA45W8F0_9RHOB|nr:cupin domain-containing protein [Paracoccus saliphilus]WCR02962.1 cupin domain-containing protein [Paracoccus saliphilus]SIT16477.1 transcriptional regulator, XRE family with cupin sensor [Paracoccus saliphilus]
MTQDETGDAESGSSRPVGATFRHLRKQQGISIQELARRSGVSVGMISQIERDLANPSMRVLTAIRRALNISMQAMFSDDQPDLREEPPFVRRADNRPFIDLGTLQKELLTSGGNHNLQIMILTIAPGASSGNTALSYPAEKGGLVLEGELVLSVDQREARLKQGDSFVFDSALEHGFRNEGDRPARILWVIGAVQFDRHL